ncbi:12566_t:CDS:2, partial [Gigaspora rosea]
EKMELKEKGLSNSEKKKVLTKIEEVLEPKELLLTSGDLIQQNTSTRYQHYNILKQEVPEGCPLVETSLGFCKTIDEAL